MRARKLGNIWLKRSDAATLAVTGQVRLAAGKGIKKVQEAARGNMKVVFVANVFRYRHRH